MSDLPRKVSARKPPSRQSMKEVPKKLVTTLAEAALPKCMVPVKYVTKFTAMPSVVNLSITSPPDIYKAKTNYQHVVSQVTSRRFIKK